MSRPDFIVALILLAGFGVGTTAGAYKMGLAACQAGQPGGR